MRSFFIAAVLLTAIYIPLALLDHHNFPYSDGAEHGAAVREMAHNLLHPGEPMLAGYQGKSSRYVPSVFAMAVCMRVFKLDILLTLKLFSILFLLFFLLSAGLFAGEYYKERQIASWSLFCFLFLWGEGWTGANAYMFAALPDAAYYPSIVAFSLALSGLYAQLRFIGTGRNAFLWCTLAAGGLSFVNHPPTGIFFLVCSVLIYTERRGDVKKPIRCFALSALSFAVLMALWPYYDFLPNFLRIASGEMGATATDYQMTRQYLYSRPLYRIGPALAGIPAVILFMKEKRYPFVTGGFLIFSALYAAGFYLHISLAERFVFFAVFFLQMAFAGVCPGKTRDVLKTLPRTALKGAGALCLLVFAAGMFFQARLIFAETLRPCFAWTSCFPFLSYHSPNAEQLCMQRYLHEGDIVFSDPFSAWAIPVYTGAKITSLFHTPPHVRDNVLRIADSERFFREKTTNADRVRILSSYGATHVICDYRVLDRRMDGLVREMGCTPPAYASDYDIFAVSKRYGLTRLDVLY